MNSKIFDRIKEFSLKKLFEKIKPLGKNDSGEISNILKDCMAALSDFVQTLVPQGDKQQNDITDTSGPITVPYDTPTVKNLNPSDDITLDNAANKLTDAYGPNAQRIPLNSRKMVSDITTALMMETMIVKDLATSKTDILSCIDFDTRANVHIDEALTLCNEGAHLADSIKNFKI